MHLAVLLIAGNGSNAALGGVPDVEHLIRRARGAGATHAVILAERVTSDLVASIARLRREGLSVDLARSVEEVTEMIHPDERVLLIPNDVIIDHERLKALAAAPVPTLLCVPDSAETADFERVDATSRWAGALLVDGTLVRTTAAMVGDWDFGSTLMRAAAQHHAGRVVVAIDALLLIGVEADRVTTSQAMLARTAVDHDGWASRTVFNPLARMSGTLAINLGIEARWVSLAGLVAFGLATITALAGWIAPSLLLFVLAEIIDRTGDILTRATMAGAPLERWRMAARLGTAAIIGTAAGTTLFFRTLQWGCAVLGIVAVGAHVLLRRVQPEPDVWRTDAGGFALIGVAGMAVAAPVVALVVVAVIAMADLARAVFRRQG